MKLFVPLLDNGNGSVMASFMRDFFEAFRERDIVFALASDSHANRGMNKIANAFIKSDCDAWFNVDADIRFRKQDVDMLIEHIENNVALVYGIYPKKEDATEPCLCTFATIDPTDPKTGLVKMRRCGRGFMLVRRDVLEAMKEDNGGPALRYHNHSDAGGANIEWDFFPSGCVTGEFSALDTRDRSDSTFHPDRDFPVDPDGYPIREWISEDWYFCERARALGYPTMVDARIALGHVGLKEYRFNQDQVTRFDSFITSWRDIHGWFDFADLYREIAVKIPEGGVFVEVGTWMGKSIAHIAEQLGRINKRVELHAVDTFSGAPASQAQADMLDAHGGNVEKIFLNNMHALGIGTIEWQAEAARISSAAGNQTIIVHVRDSVKAAEDFADGSIDAAFIDGDHSEAAVRADIEAWLPKIKEGGILAGHDIDEPGVAAAVKDSFEDFEVRHRCWLVKKVGQVSNLPDRSDRNLKSCAT